jgi:hypothetical protein
MGEALPEVCVRDRFPSRQLLAGFLDGGLFFRCFWLVVLRRLQLCPQDRIATKLV